MSLRSIRVTNGEEFSERYPSDVSRICDVLRDRGFRADRGQALQMWENYSESMCAGWMILPEDDDVLYGELQHMFEPINSRYGQTYKAGSY